ncbi:MAG TPA: hypothetical protein VMR74_08115 [Gammaproteobacteria bacterium]|nr:hypothetical protein [Gammaproteobacteria bacterium]
MKRPIRSFAVAAIAAAVSPATSGEELQRQMNVRQGPDSVFAQAAPGEIFPELAGATATGENGRVGNELVFWGYRLADGRDAYLVACAMIDAVDCAARENLVCEDGSTVLSRGTAPGLVRKVSCRSIATVGVGDTRPGCTDTEQTEELAVALMSCL